MLKASLPRVSPTPNPVAKRHYAALTALAIFMFVASASAAPTYSLIYTFSGGADGSLPQGSVLLDQSGNLYGVTAQGGASNKGVVFQLVPPNGGGSWIETVLHSFSGSDGATPAGGLLLHGGSFYGVTTSGGSSNLGTVFQLTQSGGVWTETVLHSFSGSDGVNPTVAPIADSAGALYGITPVGGASNQGVVFKLTQSSGVWTETVLHSFNGSDGTAPFGVLLIDKAGALYGSTTYTQTESGTLFKLTPQNGSWTFKTLRADSNTFMVVDFLDKSGALYGTTTAANTFFKMTPPSYKTKVLIDMGQGVYPTPGLTTGPGGVRYGGGLASQVYTLTPPVGKRGTWIVQDHVVSNENNVGMPAVSATGTIFGYAGNNGPRFGAVYQQTP